MTDIQKWIYGKYSDVQIQRLKMHLEKRFAARKNKKGCSIVFDILHRCDLNCRGCGTDAQYVSVKQINDPMPTLKDISLVFEKIAQYGVKTGKGIFVNIGGGEPFLRFDILDVLKLAAEYFTPDGVGIDTNGSLASSLELIQKALPFISYVGISINGLEKYHNWWAVNTKINAFERSTAVIGELCKDKTAVSKLEVTSVATKKNLAEIPQLISYLASLGVKNYSVHRAIPVGRMAKIIDLTPSAQEYLDLLIRMIDEAEKHKMHVHLHHSIESIHATLLLGLDTYSPDKIGNPDAGSSIGIEPEGSVVFDPWCTTGIWKSLTSGNIIEQGTELYNLLDVDTGSVLDLAKIYTAPHLRCGGCEEKCSGGSRIASAANELKTVGIDSITDTHIVDAMTAVDSACPPFYKKSEEAL